MASETPAAVELATRESYSYKDSFLHWWNRSKLEKSEFDVLSLLPFYPTSDGTRVANLENIVIDSQNNYIHELNVKNIEPVDDLSPGYEDDILLVHGYGAALGFFYKNIADLTEKPGSNLHAIDLLGYGLSSRPHLPKFKGHNKQDVELIEDYFVDSIENWRIARKIDKFSLIGHSLGGYLSSVYALKHPEHVKKLVLVSPVGVERNVLELDENGEMPVIKNKELITLTKEEFQSNRAKSSTLNLPDSNGYVAKIPPLPRWLEFIWSKRISPFTIIRGAGPLGPYLTSNWSFSRFGKNTDMKEVLKLHAYSYNTFVAKASGEHALGRLLGPAALPRYPLLKRVPQALKMDSLWLYGDKDWMSKEAGEVMCREINKAGQAHAEYQIISDAGHNLFIDNPKQFKDAVIGFLYKS